MMAEEESVTFNDLMRRLVREGGDILRRLAVEHEREVEELRAEREQLQEKLAAAHPGTARLSSVGRSASPAAPAFIPEDSSKSYSRRSAPRSKGRRTNDGQTAGGFRGKPDEIALAKACALLDTIAVEEQQNLELIDALQHQQPRQQQLQQGPQEQRSASPAATMQQDWRSPPIPEKPLSHNAREGASGGASLTGTYDEVSVPLDEREELSGSVVALAQVERDARGDDKITCWLSPGCWDVASTNEAHDPNASREGRGAPATGIDDPGFNVAVPLPVVKALSPAEEVARELAKAQAAADLEDALQATPREAADLLAGSVPADDGKQVSSPATPPAARHQRPDTFGDDGIFGYSASPFSPSMLSRPVQAPRLPHLEESQDAERAGGAGPEDDPVEDEAHNRSALTPPPTTNGIDAANAAAVVHRAIPASAATPPATTVAPPLGISPRREVYGNAVTPPLALLSTARSETTPRVPESPAELQSVPRFLDLEGSWGPAGYHQGVTSGVQRPSGPPGSLRLAGMRPGAQVPEVSASPGDAPQVSSLSTSASVGAQQLQRGGARVEGPGRPIQRATLPVTRSAPSTAAALGPGASATAAGLLGTSTSSQKAAPSSPGADKQAPRRGRPTGDDGVSIAMYLDQPRSAASPPPRPLELTSPPPTMSVMGPKPPAKADVQQAAVKVAQSPHPPGVELDSPIPATATVAAITVSRTNVLGEA